MVDYKTIGGKLQLGDGLNNDELIVYVEMCHQTFMCLNNMDNGREKYRLFSTHFLREFHTHVGYLKNRGMEVSNKIEVTVGKTKAPSVESIMEVRDFLEQLGGMFLLCVKELENDLKRY